MSRTLPLLIATIMMILPFSAKAVESALPEVIQTALHDAASTGNPLVVDAVADRMSNLFPSYRSTISTYVAEIAVPAAAVMASVNTMLADLPKHKDQGFALFETHEMTNETEAASLADDLNNLEIGSGSEESSVIQ